jgi:hypothetical protein
MTVRINAAQLQGFSEEADTGQILSVLDRVFHGSRLEPPDESYEDVSRVGARIPWLC